MHSGQHHSSRQSRSALRLARQHAHAMSPNAASESAAMVVSGFMMPSDSTRRLHLLWS